MARDVRHPLFARIYDRCMSGGEQTAEAAEHRREMLAGLSGRVVEIGAGNGLNFAHYPPEVDEVIAVEPEDYLRRRAETVAAEAPVRVRVVDGLADRLPLENDSVEAAVASLVLCSVPDPASALAEARRVIRPGGELRFYEHVIARDPGFARMQRIVGRFWPLIAGGCHSDRDTGAAIEAAGFEIETCRRFDFRPSPLVYPLTPKIVGRARRPR